MHFHQPFLGAEVIVDRRRRGSGFSGDFGHGHNTVTALVHGNDGGFDQLFIADISDAFSSHTAVLRYMRAGYKRCYVASITCMTVQKTVWLTGKSW